MKRRRARERDQEDAREQADRRREELLARLRGGQAAPSEPTTGPETEAAKPEPMAEADAEADAEAEEAQLPPAASEAPSLDGSADEKPEVGDVG